MVNSMADDVERWALERDWSVFRESKTIEERSTSYQVPVVRVRSASGEVWFDPIGADILGADARIDLGHWPNNDRFVLVLQNGQWRVRTDEGTWIRRKWGRSLFHDLVTTPKYAAA
jgi:hypothetical protein